MALFNTIKYIKKGVFKGLKLDICDIKVQRLSDSEYTQVSGSAELPKHPKDVYTNYILSTTLTSKEIEEGMKI